MQGLDPESDLYKTYAVQKSLLEAQVEEQEGSLSSSMAQGEMALLQLGDAAYQVRRQADNIEGQLAQTAQTLLITIQNLKYNRGQLERQLAS